MSQNVFFVTRSSAQSIGKESIQELETIGSFMAEPVVFFKIGVDCIVVEGGLFVRGGFEEQLTNEKNTERIKNMRMLCDQWCFICSKNMRISYTGWGIVLY